MRTSSRGESSQRRAPSALPSPYRRQKSGRAGVDQPEAPVSSTNRGSSAMALLKALNTQASVGERLRPVGLFALLALLFLPLGFRMTPSARAQAPGVNGILYSNQAAFRIPFVMEPGAGQLREVQLYASDNQGQTWSYLSSAAPEQRGFDYHADRDGLYWFTVRTIDMQGRAVPLTLQQTAPQLRVAIDTRKPNVTLRGRSASSGLVAVEGDIREENLDPAK